MEKTRRPPPPRPYSCSMKNPDTPNAHPSTVPCLPFALIPFPNLTIAHLSSLSKATREKFVPFLH